MRRRRLCLTTAPHQHDPASRPPQVGSEFSANPTEQQRQLEALRVLDAALDSLRFEEGLDFSGLHFHAYHPDAPPLADAGGGGPAAVAAMGDGIGFVSDDGCLHVVADRHTLRFAPRALRLEAPGHQPCVFPKPWSVRVADSKRDCELDATASTHARSTAAPYLCAPRDVLLALDLDRARVLTRVTMFWLRRVRDLSPALTALLGVQNVWCDTRTEQNSQNFVIWAGYVLEQRWVFERGRGGLRRTFAGARRLEAVGAVGYFTAGAAELLGVDASAPQLLGMHGFSCHDAPHPPSYLHWP